MLCHFCLFFMLCSRCFQPSGKIGLRAPQAQPESSMTIYICIFVPLPQSHFTKLLIRAFLFEPCHCSYIFVPCLAFRIHVASDLNKTISFVVKQYRSLDFVRSRFTRAHLLEQGFPTWGTCTPRGTFAYPKGYI